MLFILTIRLSTFDLLIVPYDTSLTDTISNICKLLTLRKMRVVVAKHLKEVLQTYAIQYFPPQKETKKVIGKCIDTFCIQKNYSY